MALTTAQRDHLDQEGYLLIPNVFSQEEIRILTDAVPAVFSWSGPELVREKNGAVRTAFACHRYSETFSRLARHPRMLGPIMEILGGPIYLHQFKLNAKAAFDGDVWQWHQDFVTWHNDDGMAEPRAMNIAVFLDDVNEFNGPLMFIPRSHRHGAVPAGHDTTTTSYPLWTVNQETIRDLVDRGGIVAPKGPAGSLLLFSSLLVHSSGSNMSPWHRRAVYVTGNRVDNPIRTPTRPEWIAHQDFTPLEPFADDCLVSLEAKPADATV